MTIDEMSATKMTKWSVCSQNDCWWVVSKLGAYY